MKKTICILICLVMALSICSCSKNDGLVALEIGGNSESIDTGVHSSDYALWSSENYTYHEDTAAPETYTITFNGVELTGTYLYSQTDRGDSFQRDKYKVDSLDGYLGGFFDINTSTGEVVFFFRQREYPEGYSSNVRGDYSFDECQAAAEELAAQFINTESYILETEEGTSLDSFDYVYYVDGVETRDCVSILVSTYTGEVVYYFSGDLGAFAESNAATTSASDSVSVSEAVENLKSEEATAVLEAKIKTIYSDYISYSVSEQTLVRFEDGSIGLLCMVDVTIPWAQELESGETSLYTHYAVTILLCNSSSVTE
ncbi:MAG: hypothetical protein LUG88_06675 [Clostridia bacterium]|nr:hypothetical protein [Clostridia bacterium]